MKKFLLSFLILISLNLAAQQAKQVYITLDVSGSMFGTKYELANYTTQMLVSMCDKQDDIYIIINEKAHELSGLSNPLSTLQHPLNTLPILGSGSSQFDDIIAFINYYKPSNDKQNWLFIVGDGIWETMNYGSSPGDFKKVIKDGSLNVCYLQTGNYLNENNDFTQFVSKLGIVDIRKSDTNPKTIQNECNHFAKKIMGFSDQDLKISRDFGGKTITFVSELPVSEFLIVYQDNISPTDLPKIQQVSADGHSFNCLLQGTPSTAKLGGNVLLSGNVWRVKANSSIPAGKDIKITFDRKVDSKKIHIYPIFNSINQSSFVIDPSVESGQLRMLDDKTSTICRENNRATIFIELSDEDKHALSEELLKKSIVTVKANNKTYPATYTNGRFECDIKLESDETPYFAEIDCPGYFKRTTSIKRIVKNDDCPPPSQTNETYHTKASFNSFYRIPNLTIIDEETKEILDPNQFDVYVKDIENEFLYESVDVQIKDNTICIDIKLKDNVCECLFPKNLNFTVVAKPKKDAHFEDGKQYREIIQPIQLEITKNTPWLLRCKWVLLAIGGLILFIIYLGLMMRKNRFKKNAMINPFVWLKTKGEYIPMGGYRLRKKGFAAWFSRWFLPFDEKRSISMNTPKANFTFIATESRSRIKFPISEFITDMMIVMGFDPAHARKKDVYIKLSDHGIIELLKEDGNKDGKLQFEAGKKNDESGFQFFLGLLMIAAAVGIGILVYLMIRAL